MAGCAMPTVILSWPGGTESERREAETLLAPQIMTTADAAVTTCRRRLRAGRTRPGSAENRRRTLPGQLIRNFDSIAALLADRTRFPNLERIVFAAHPVVRNWCNATPWLVGLIRSSPPPACIRWLMGRQRYGRQRRIRLRYVVAKPIVVPLL